MYGLEKDICLSFFNGKTLLQVRFGVHDLILHFDGDVSVTVSSSVGCRMSGGVRQPSDDFRQVAPTLLAMLNQSVRSAEGDEAGTLTIRFDGGGALAIYDDSKEYESYTIQKGKQLIVVYVPETQESY